jgi:4-hydroxybenzoate polyprenyltransferase
MRLDRPIGTHLLFLPAAWSITLGSSSVVDAISLYSLFYGGAVLLRGAGCTINDIWDADIDGRVARTRGRPLASGEVSQRGAFLFLSAQLSAGLAVLLSLNNTAVVVGAPSVIPVMLYPLAKRMTDYPQAVLGLTFNWGALLGYAAAADTLAPAAFCLYGAGWCWTMIYDTIYAHQDKKDDVQVGVRSSALALGDQTKPALALLAVGKLGLLAAAGFAADLSMPFYGGIALTGAHVGWQIVSTDLNDPEQCLSAFKSNTTTGVITWFSCCAGLL